DMFGAVKEGLVSYFKLNMYQWLPLLHEVALWVCGIVNIVIIEFRPKDLVICKRVYGVEFATTAFRGFIIAYIILLGFQSLGMIWQT
ncbi:hypothetical protein, partial [Vibrio cholerae]|uniref:hypothetical protein n=1 Tax=Vibrio cholerae TaxID=666 RepID=UPI001F21507C